MQINDGLKHIISNTLWMIFDKIFMLVINLIVIVKIANYYGTRDYGNYQYTVSVVAIFEILVTFVDARVIKKRYTSLDPELLVWNATISRILFSMLSGVIGFIYLLISRTEREHSIMFAVLLLNAIVINLRFGMTNRYEFLLKSRKIVIASDMATLIGVFFQLLAVDMHWSIISISIITLFSSIINFVIITIQYIYDFGHIKNKHIDKQLIKNIILESTPLAVAASCATIYSKCDSVMIGSMLSKSDVGIYSIAVKLLSVVQIAATPIEHSVYPKLISLYQQDQEKYVKKYIQISSILTWIYIIGVSISMFILPYIFKFLNDEYALAFPVYRIYVLGAFFIYNATLKAGHFTLINRGNILMYAQIFSVIINIILNSILIRVIGIYGAALATVITQAVSLMISNLFFHKDGIDVFIWQIKAINPIHIFRKI